MYNKGIKFEFYWRLISYVLKKNKIVINMFLFELNNENGKFLFLFGEKVYYKSWIFIVKYTLNLVCLSVLE